MLTIEARNVKPGDRVYNTMAYHPSAAWERVKKVFTATPDGRKYTVIETVDGLQRWMDPRAGIAVKRAE